MSYLTEWHRNPKRKSKNVYEPWSSKSTNSGMDLMYMHDDSENTEDSFTIQLTDGRHHIHRQVTVKVVPVNDEEPRVIRSDWHFMIDHHTTGCRREEWTLCPSFVLQEQWAGGGARRGQAYIQCHTVCTGQWHSFFWGHVHIGECSHTGDTSAEGWFSATEFLTLRLCHFGVCKHWGDSGRCCVPNCVRRVKTGWHWHRGETARRRRWTWTFCATCTQACTVLKHRTSLFSTCWMERIDHRRSTSTSQSKI